MDSMQGFSTHPREDPGKDSVPPVGNKPRQRRYSLKEELFTRALDAIRRDNRSVEVSAGLKGVKLLDWADSTLHLEVPHEFSRKLFERSVRPLMETSLNSLTGTEIRLRLHVAQENLFSGRKRVRSFRPRKATLKDFIVDENNRLAHQLLLEYRKGKPLFDPFLIYGPSRSGKTHLLRGFLELMQTGESAGTLKYMTATVFGRAYRATLYRRRIESFREEMDSPRIFILDDIHSLKTMPGTQSELARMLERRQMLGFSTILASRSHPDQIDGLESALSSRMLGGMVLRLSRLRSESLTKYLKGRLLKRGIRLEKKVLDRAVELSNHHPNTAESILLSAVAVAREAKRPVTPDSIHPLSPPTPESGPDWKKVLRMTDQVATFFGVTAADIQSPRKVRRALVPRRLLALALRQGFHLTSSEIGRFLGGRSISTVTVMLRQGKALIEEETTMRELLAHVLSELEEGIHDRS